MTWKHSPNLNSDWKHGNHCTTETIIEFYSLFTHLHLHCFQIKSPECILDIFKFLRSLVSFAIIVKVKSEKLWLIMETIVTNQFCWDLSNILGQHSWTYRQVQTFHFYFFLQWKRLKNTELPLFFIKSFENHVNNLVICRVLGQPYLVDDYLKTVKAQSAFLANTLN